MSSRRAAKVLHGIFGQIRTAFAFRLWDGTQVPLGDGAPVVTIHVRTPETFIRLVRDPSPLNFAEAYVESAIDVEGDLFRAMSVATALEEIRLSFPERLRILATLWRG